MSTEFVLSACGVVPCLAYHVYMLAKMSLDDANNKNGSLVWHWTGIVCFLIKCS